MSRRSLEFSVYPLWEFLEASSDWRGSINSYPPYSGAGIRVTFVSDDFSRIEVELREEDWNRNYVGAHFGGSLYSMCDPFFMFMLMKKLGPEYIVWDKSAKIDFLKPGTGTVTATFEITEEQMNEIHEEFTSKRSFDKVFVAETKNEAGVTIARIEKTLYLRRMRR